MKTTVLVTHLDDERVLATIDSLRHQHRAPDEVVVADGGSDPALLRRIRAALEGMGRVLEVPGSVAASRAAALEQIRGDIVLFLDADEQARPDWLALLVHPIEQGAADVTGGPTRPTEPARTAAQAYVDRFDAWFYQHVVAHDAASLPMGNSAWRTRLLRDIGGFDARFAWGGEDYDVNLRARAAGARFQYVPDAWVRHDQSHLDRLPRLWRRMRTYACGATMAYRKNGALGDRVGPAARASRFRHRYQPLMLVAKGVGFIEGTVRWRRLQRLDLRHRRPG